ncbi:LppX_LprAFG lipoprotein [Actinomadura barringtoniae]|uniref:LppX_LprAFG lipoprotein n=1 Tax=Actinomadura barringtoniae TaxID=1427535 RepID=A0A939PET6_9ACTN|nr:LppX_LprAFG lipoprotein [Actinomadura barringtoniae]MBO2451335.1 LppX_LprAFG lipoprotein [Actinomadura barringtoniae]
MIRRFAAGTAVATGLAMSLTGCLGSGGDKAGGGGGGDAIQLTAAQVLDKAAQKTSSTDSVKADMSMQGTTAQGSMNMSGTMQYRTKPDLAMSMNFSTMSMGGKSMGGMQEILVDKTMYMKMPMLQQLSQMGGNKAQMKPWLKISLAQLGQKAGLNFDQLMEQARQADPAQNTKLLTSSKDVKEVGKETIDGVSTTHYRGTYRMADAISKLSPEQRQAYEKLMAKAGGAGSQAMPFDLWVDGQQLPKKMTMSMAMTATEKMNMTMTYKDYGKPVDITAPPADQVTDMSELLKNMPGAGAGAGSGIPGA